MRRSHGAGLAAIAFVTLLGLGCSEKTTCVKCNEGAPLAPVADLHAASATDRAIVLTWTAPGEAGTNQRAIRYDIRHVTGALDDEAWISAIRVPSIPAPKAAGASETLRVAGLAPETAYRFALKSMGLSSNWSPLSNIAARTTLVLDAIHPAQVTNLVAAFPTDTSLTLTWTAPGDDEDAGSAVAYDLRYTTADMTGRSWDSATRVPSVPAPDSSGTRQSVLVTGLAGGISYHFAIRSVDEVGNWSPLSNVASETTTSNAPDYWSEMGGGMDGAIYVLAVHGSDLIAGGSFTQAGSVAVSNIARWRDGAWSDLGGSGAGPDGRVEALVSAGADLIVGGTFSQVAGLETPGVARWDGAAWRAMGSGIGGGDVLTLIPFRGGIIAGGQFPPSDTTLSANIAYWDGGAWTSMGTGTNGPIGSLAVWNGLAVASGDFTRAGGVTVDHVAAWDGAAWQAMGEDACAGRLLVVDGDLLSISPDCVSRWTGSSWDRLAPGVGPVGAVAVYGSGIVIASDENVLRWDWTAWRVLGKAMNAPIYGLVAYEGDLIAAGWFTRAGDAQASRIARWLGR